MKLLEAFVVDNPELEELEALVAQFNAFEALGVVRQELRHSDFLAFLLSPRESHGLGDLFAKRLLQRALIGSGRSDLPLSLIDLDTWSLDGMVVQREWQSIDLLLVDEAHRLVVVIENKIGSSEHSEQLVRYAERINRTHPGWAVIALYLTPGGDTPSDEGYIAVSYTQVCVAVEDLLTRRGASLAPDVQVFMSHYAQMLRRHIVSESRVAELCTRIYKKHQKALDLIYEHRPYRQALLATLLEQLITDTPGLALDHSGKKYIRFVSETWDSPLLRTGKGWTASGRMLLFELVNSTESLTLLLWVGPGPADIRARLLDAARRGVNVFRNLPRSTGAKHQSVYSLPFLKRKDYDAEDADLADRIRGKWETFVTDELPRITGELNQERWIWDE